MYKSQTIKLAVSGDVLSCIHKTYSLRVGGGEATWLCKEIKESLLASRKRSPGMDKEGERAAVS